jgi:transposase-like protein
LVDTLCLREKTMMEKRKRRKFTPEFKAEAVKQVVEEKRPVSQVAKALGIWEASLTGWVGQAKTDRGEGATRALTSEERAELAALRREVKNLRVEREILKKATAFFAKENT